MGPGSSDSASWRNRRTLALILFGAFCLHNTEEALTFARYRSSAEDLARRLLGAGIALPRPAGFHAALLMVTIAGGMCLCWVATGADSPFKRRALKLFATMLLANAFIPHIPAAIALGGYTPGLVTAVLINMPLAIFVLRTRQ